MSYPNTVTVAHLPNAKALRAFLRLLPPEKYIVSERRICTKKISLRSCWVEVLEAGGYWAFQDDRPTNRRKNKLMLQGDGWDRRWARGYKPGKFCFNPDD
jgi:hypothetical protein